MQQFVPANVFEKFVREGMHGNMVQPAAVPTKNLPGFARPPKRGRLGLREHRRLSA
jgi:hypothetical protein